MQLFFALSSGLIFGLGLILSGMTDPAKVLGFLDVAGRWDPSLALVMAGAIAVAMPAFRLAALRMTTFTGKAIQLPPGRVIDVPLIAGALLFGAGWGLAGFCPGPALASVLTGGMPAVMFVAAMVAGMAVFEIHGRQLRRQAAR